MTSIIAGLIVAVLVMFAVAILLCGFAILGVIVALPFVLAAALYQHLIDYLKNSSE